MLFTVRRSSTLSCLAETVIFCSLLHGSCFLSNFLYKFFSSFPEGGRRRRRVGMLRSDWYQMAKLTHCLLALLQMAALPYSHSCVLTHEKNPSRENFKHVFRRCRCCRKKERKNKCARARKHSGKLVYALCLF